MEPINKAERKKTFVNFLLFFIICIGLVATVIFFSIEAPFKQNEQLLKEMRSDANDQKFSESFMTDMSAIAGMLDTINTKAQKPELLDGQITESIKKLNVKVDTDSAFHKDMYRSIVFILSDLQAVRKQIRNFTGNSNNSEELRRQLEAAGNELNAAKIENMNLKQQVFMLQQKH